MGLYCLTTGVVLINLNSLITIETIKRLGLDDRAFLMRANGYFGESCAIPMNTRVSATAKAQTRDHI